MTRVSTGARSTGLMTMRWMRIPPPKASTIVTGNAIQKLIPWLISV